MGDTQNKKFNPWLIVLGALGCNSLLISLANLDGFFLAPVMEEFNWTRTQASLYMTIYSWIAAAMQVFVGKLFEKHDVRKIMGGIVILYGVSYMATSAFTHVWQWSIFGILYGVAAGFFMYIPGALLITRWFSKRTGFAMALPGIITGILGFFLNPMCQNMLTKYGWSKTRVILGAVFMIVCFILTILFVRSSPESVGQKPYGYEEVTAGSEKKDTDHGTVELKGVTAKQAFKMPAFYLSIVFTFLVCIVCCFVQQIASYAAALPIGAMAGAFALSIFSVIGLPRSPIMGWIFDKFGSFAGNFLSTIVSVIGTIMIILGGGKNVPLFYVGVACWSFMFVPLTMGTSLLVKDVFGDKEYSSIYSYMSTSLLISAGVAPLVYAQIYDRSQSYETYPVFVLIMAIIVTALVPIIYFFGKRDAAKLENS